MRRRYRSALASPVNCGLAIWVLIFGLVMPPLLVECVREDGHVLVEIAGHDTCHEETPGEHPAADAEQGRAPGVDAGEWHDPCLDLSLYRPADAQAGADLAPHLSDGTALQAGIKAFCTTLEGRGAVHKPPPKLLLPSADPAFLPLRI